MFKLIHTWWQESRVLRKFRRDTAAMISLVVIGVYAAIFLWTVVTPLNVDYVNLQERKLGQHKEYKQTVKDLTQKRKQLQAQVDASLQAALQPPAEAAPPAAAPVPPSARRAQPESRKRTATRSAPRTPEAPKAPTSRVAARAVTNRVPARAATRRVAARAVTSRPVVIRRTALPVPSRRLVVPTPSRRPVRVQARATTAPPAVNTRPPAPRGQEGLKLTQVQARIQHLRQAVLLQQQISALEREKMMAQIQLQKKPPKPLGWLSRYNQDTGQAYARPLWRGPNEEEATILAMIEPHLPFAATWVRQTVLAHGRRGVLGSDRLGRSIFKRVLVSVNVAFKIGLVTALIACFIGLILGGIAGFFGGWIDLVITWIYSVFSAVPYIVLVLLIAAIFRDKQGLTGLYVAFGMTFWIGPARVVRGEVMKIKEMEYVQAAWILGNSRLRILFRHVLPNTMHLIFVYFSLIFIGAIKSEVILTFLGLGVKNMPSWGGMISDASKEIIGGFWWQMIGASVALFFLVYAFNIFTDALQDALDPKHTK